MSNNLAINMAGGQSHRVSPGAWRRPKGLWPMVGRRMFTRIFTELYQPNGLKDILITTCLSADKLDVYVKANQRMFKKAGLKVGTFIPEGKETEKFLNSVNTAHSVLLGYKQKHNIVQDMCALAGLQKIPAVEDLSTPEILAIHQKIKDGTASEANKDKLNTLQQHAADAIANSLKPLPEEHPPFIVTGCDALSTGDLKSMYETYLDAKQKGALGLIKIKGYPSTSVDLVMNYGIILIEDIKNGSEQDV
ncbi:MAG: hypothetical protein V3T21_00770, partial [Candidatus Margulisiibacteriota bacterium]